MKLADNWDSDPLVLVQKAVSPVLFAGPEVLCRLMVGATLTDQNLSELMACFEPARATLETGGAEFFDPAGSELMRRKATSAEALRNPCPKPIAL